MSLRSRRFVQLVLPVIAAMCLSAAPPQQLNPTVSVLPAPTTAVPPECEEGLAQARPRATPEEKIIEQQITAAPEMKAPPSKDLRSTATEVQTAAERNDRAGFTDALARLKAMLATYPTGGERTAAEKAVAVYDDLDRVWTYQLTPAGAFFDESSDVYRIVSQYPGYDAFIREQILTDRSGAKFYPTAESRVFLAQIAATRVKDLGVRTVAEASPTPPTVATPPPVKPAPRSVAVEKAAPEQPVERAAEPKVRTTKPAPKHVQAAPAAPVTTAKASSKPKRAKAAAAEPAPKHAAAAARKTTPEKKPASAAKVTEAAPKSASVQPRSAAPLTATTAPAIATSAPTATAPSARTASQPTETTVTTATETAPVPPTATTASAAPATETTATETTATETTGTSGATKESGKPNEPRNLLMPIILIVVGVGVLILLFRTSSGTK